MPGSDESKEIMRYGSHQEEGKGNNGIETTSEGLLKKTKTHTRIWLRHMFGIEDMNIFEFRDFQSIAKRHVTSYCESQAEYMQEWKDAEGDKEKQIKIESRKIVGGAFSSSHLYKEIGYEWIRTTCNIDPHIIDTLFQRDNTTLKEMVSRIREKRNINTLQNF